MAFALILAALLTGCQPSEAEVLVAAAAAVDHAGAVAACERLAGVPRDECLVGQAERFSAGAVACEAVVDARWNGECRFQLAERLVRTGEAAEAMELCVATPFARECSYHLLREAARGVILQPPAEAAAALDAWRSMPGAADSPRLFWKAYFRERRGADLDDDPTTCPDDVCRRGARETYFESVRALYKSDRAAFCAAPPTTISGWVDTPETAEWLATWTRDTCARDAGSLLAPRAIPPPP